MMPRRCQLSFAAAMAASCCILTVTTMPALAFVTPTTTTMSSCQAHSSSLSMASTPCSVELIDPETGCEVVLLGCFHGSTSSAMDVEHAMKEKRTDVVALELCADRFADLRRDFDSAEQKQRRKQHKEQQQQQELQPWFLRYTNMIANTAQSKGLPTAAAAAVLGGVSGMQTALSGLQPGLEFTTALGVAVEDNDKYYDVNDIDIVLADQNVDETLAKVGDLPRISLMLWKEFFMSGLNWKETFGKEAESLGNALWGNGIKDYSVQLPTFLTRSEAAVRDMIRLTIPPFVILQCVNLSISHAVTYLITGDPDFAWARTSTSTPMDSTTLILANVLFLSIAYLSVALPAARVILRERDDQLTDGIQAACRLAARKHKDDPNNNGRVVAVLGLLHVNGIAKRILEQSKETTKSSTPPV